MEKRSYVAAGFAALSHRKLILLLALTTAVLGLSGAMALIPTMSSWMAGTLAGDHLIRNHPTFAPTDFFDFLREKAPAIEGMHRAAAWVGVLGALFQMVFVGGIIAVLGRGPFSFAEFAEPARRNFWHNVKCFLLFAILGLLVLGPWFAGEKAAEKKLFEGLPPDAPLRSAARWGTVLVGLGLFATLSLLYDFARAARRYAPTIGAWRAWAFARRALSGSWLRALGFWLSWLGLGAAGVLMLFAVTWEMPAVSLPAIALLFLLQFAALAMRAAVRVGAWGSTIAFLDPRARPALSAPAKKTPTVAAPTPIA